MELALINDVLYISISVHNNYKHRLLGPNRLLDFEGGMNSFLFGLSMRTLTLSAFRHCCD